MWEGDEGPFRSCERRGCGESAHVDLWPLCEKHLRRAIRVRKVRWAYVGVGSLLIIGWYGFVHPTEWAGVAIGALMLGRSWAMWPDADVDWLHAHPGEYDRNDYI